jgi:hypothetical protein
MDREILPLHIGRADMARIGIAIDRRGYHLRDSWGRVPAGAGVLCRVVLLQLGVIHIRSGIRLPLAALVSRISAVGGGTCQSLTQR